METKQIPPLVKLCFYSNKASVVNWNGYTVESLCPEWAKQHYIYGSEETLLETYGLLSEPTQSNKLWNTVVVFVTLWATVY